MLTSLQDAARASKSLQAAIFISFYFIASVRTILQFIVMQEFILFYFILHVRPALQKLSIAVYVF